MEDTIHADMNVEMDDAFITRVRGTILQNLEDEDFGIAQLCSSLLMGRTQLHNNLKELTGY